MLQRAIGPANLPEGVLERTDAMVTLLEQKLTREHQSQIRLLEARIVALEQQLNAIKK